MLSEGFKVNLRRKAGKEAARRVAKEGIAAKREQLARAKATRYNIGGFVAGSAMSHIISKPVSKIKRHLIIKDVQRSNKKLMKKRAKMQQMHEGFLWDKVKPHLQKSKVGGQLLKKHGPKLQKGLDYAWGSKAKVAAKAGSMALKHPVAGLIGGTALAVGAGAMKGIASDFIKHKARMKMDPNYAQQTRHAAEAERQLKSNVTPKPIQGTNPSMKATTPNTQDEHPSPIASKVAKKGHQKHHAHSAVLRGMDPTKINTVGKAAKNYQLTNRTKTNTRKESYMNLDNIIERAADNVYAIEEGWGNTAVSAAKKGYGIAKKIVTSGSVKTAWKNRKVVGSALAHKARAGAQKGLDYAAGKYQMHKMKRKPIVSDIMADRAGGIYEIAPSKKELARRPPPGSSIDTKLNRTIGNPANYLRLKKKGLIKDSVDEVAPIIGAAVGAAGRYAVKAAAGYVANKAANKVIKKLTPKSKVEAFLEAMAPGARSQFEINRVKDVRQFYGMQRSQHVDSAEAKAAEQRKKINKRGGAAVSEGQVYQGLKIAAGGAKKGFKQFAKEHPKMTKYGVVAGAALATAGLANKSAIIQSNRAKFHRKRYNAAAARLQYLQNKKANKAELKASLKAEDIIESNKVEQAARDKAKTARRELAKAFLDRRFAAKKKSVKEDSSDKDADWRRKKIEAWRKAKAAKKDKKKNDDDKD